MEFRLLVRWLFILCYKLSIIQAVEESSKVHFTNSWAVHIENGNDEIASQIAEKHGFFNFGQIGSLPGYYQFVHKEKRERRKRREVSKTVTLLLEDKPTTITDDDDDEDYDDISYNHNDKTNDKMSDTIDPELDRRRRDVDEDDEKDEDDENIGFHKDKLRNGEHQVTDDKGTTRNIKIQWVEQQHVLERDKRSIIPDYIDVIHPNGYTIQDPLYSDQWYINNVGQSSGPPGLDINVLPVWSRGISGKGVVVAILDDGLDHTHPDLKANYSPTDAKASYDFNDYDEDPMPRSSDPNNCHGTKCAGEVAAEAGNGVCGVGVAFNSSVGGIRMLDGNVTDTIEGSALSYHKDYIDIYSCAWGPKDDGKRFGRPGTLASKALELGVKEGRNGLGSIFVWATGNGGLTDDDCNCDGYTTSVYTVSIGAISDHGLSTYYTESCASTLAVTYSGGSHREKKENKIVTTTLGHKCTDEFKGTSSAAPLAAGMIALVLESNSNVTWRDIQHIIVETSVMSSPLDEGWRRNGAGKWFNQKFGFGRMDAAAMVEKATTWANVMEQRNCWSDKSSGPWTIPSSGTLLVAMNTTACAETTSNIKTVEHVQVVVSLAHRRRGHLSIELISPSGTRTQLLKTRRNDRSTKGLKDWVFMSVHFWGEDPKGLWTLAVTDNNNNDREHHLEKNKYGDMEDATGALQDLIEDKEDTAEHEKIVEDDDLFKSAEEFENSIFKDSTYRRKNKAKETENHQEAPETSPEQNKQEAPVPIVKNAEEETGGKTMTMQQSSDAGSAAGAPKESAKDKAAEIGDAIHKEESHEKMKSKESKKGKAKRKKDEKIADKIKSSEKKKKKKSHSKSKPKSKKKKLTVEEEAEEKIVEELLKDSKPPFQEPLKANTAAIPSHIAAPANQTAPVLPASPAPINMQNAVPYVNVTQHYQASYLPAPLAPPPVNMTAPFSGPSVPVLAALSENISKPTNGTENNKLESVLRNVLNEVFTNFKQENQGYKLLADRIEGLELALQDKNKTQARTAEQTYSSVLLNAFKKGKPIDKIQNVLGVLENGKNLTKHQNSSFSKNAEVVTDVLKVLKDILSTKKDDSELKGYKKRISKLLETSSNSTRQLTEKLFSDIEPSGEGKEDSANANVMNDALSLISQIFQRNKPHQSTAKVSKDFHISVKGSNNFNGKENDNVESLTKESAPTSDNPHEDGEYEPNLTNILLHGDFLKNGVGQEKGETPMGDVDKAGNDEDELKDKDQRNDNTVKVVKPASVDRKMKEEYEIVGIAEKNGEQIISHPDNGNELGMSKTPEDITFKGEEVGTDDDSRHHNSPGDWHHGSDTGSELTQEGAVERHHKLIHLGELQDWHPEGEHIHEDVAHQRHATEKDLEEARAAFHSRAEAETAEDTHVGKHDFPGDEGEDASKKDLEDDNGDFTIAIMKGGKKIGEKKINKFTASHYLIKPKLSNELFHEEEAAKPATTSDDDALLRNSLFDYNRGLINDRKSQSSTVATEDTAKNSNSEYSKEVIRKTTSEEPTDIKANTVAGPGPETPNIPKEVDFDVTKFALNENRFVEHTTDHAGKHEAEDVVEDSSGPPREVKPTEEVTTRKLTTIPKEEKEVKEYNGDKGELLEKEEKDSRPENSKRKLSDSSSNEEKEEIQPVVKKASEPKKVIKKLNAKAHARKLRGGHRKYDNMYDSRFLQFSQPLPFMQLPDPSQFAQIPVQAEENENFVQPDFGSYNPSGSPNSLPDYREHTTFFENGNGYEVENGRRLAEFERKRSDIPSAPVEEQIPLQSIPMFPTNEVEEFANEHEGRLLRRRRSIDLDDEPPPSKMKREDPLFRVKRDTIETEDDDEDDDGPHVVKRSAIITEIFPSENPRAAERRSVDEETPADINNYEESSIMYPSETPINEKRSVVPNNDDKIPLKVKRNPLSKNKKRTTLPSNEKRSSPTIIEKHVFSVNSEKRVSTPTNEKRASATHRSTKQTRKSSFSAKRSAVRKATDISTARDAREKPTSKESSSVLNIIKRVHDDIAVGNSKDLRRLEAELARLEGISMSESNEQVNSFEKLASGGRINTVRTKVSKKYREDPDEYYKYGATASGILESWTLHFYGTGP